MGAHPDLGVLESALEPENLQDRWRARPAVIADPLVADLASAYFLATFLFAGYVLKVYIELAERLETLESRLDQFKYLEEELDTMTADFFEGLIQEGS